MARKLARGKQRLVTQENPKRSGDHAETSYNTPWLCVCIAHGMYLSVIITPQFKERSIPRGEGMIMYVSCECPHGILTSGCCKVVLTTRGGAYMMHLGWAYRPFRGWPRHLLVLLAAARLLDLLDRTYKLARGDFLADPLSLRPWRLEGRPQRIELLASCLFLSVIYDTWEALHNLQL